MTRFLRERLTRANRRGPVDGTERDWRQVPRISFLPERRSSIFTPLVLALAVLALGEAVALYYLNSDLQLANETAEAARGDLDEMNHLVSLQESALVEENARIENVERQIEQFAARNELEQQVYSELADNRTDWGVAFKALLLVDGPDIRFTRIETGLGGLLKVTGTATGVPAMGRFREHMKEMDYYLDLRSFQWTEGESSLPFTAEVVVR